MQLKSTLNSEFGHINVTPALETYKPTFLHLAPPLLAFCADNAGVKAESLERLHHIMTGAAPAGKTLLTRFKKKAPSVLIVEGKSIFLLIFLFFSKQLRLRVDQLYCVDSRKRHLLLY